MLYPTKKRRVYTVVENSQHWTLTMTLNKHRKSPPKSTKFSSETKTKATSFRQPGRGKQFIELSLGRICSVLHVCQRVCFFPAPSYLCASPGEPEILFTVSVSLLVDVYHKIPSLAGQSDEPSGEIHRDNLRYPKKMAYTFQREVPLSPASFLWSLWLNFKV